VLDTKKDIVKFSAFLIGQKVLLMKWVLISTSISLVNKIYDDILENECPI
jgi:hypothetical protein